MLLKRFGPAVLACALLLGGCGQEDGDSAADTGEDAEKTEKTDDAEETPAIPVEVSSPVRGDIYAVYAGTAPIEAFAEADVVAKVDGEVRELLVEEGDIVVKNQVLARLDGEMLRLELNESEARLRKLQRDYERNVDLKEKGLISTGDFDKIRYEMEALEASYNLARLEHDYTQIRAPIGGVVSERIIKIGNTVAVGDPLFTVTSFTPLVAYLHIPEREYRSIQKGQVAVIDIDALKSEPIVADVSRVSPVVDPITGTFKATIEIDNLERQLKPGMFARIGIVYDKHENALKIPRSAILEDADEKSVFVVVDDKAVRTKVATGFSDKGMVEILDGISDGDRIVTVGHVGLKDDATVAVIGDEDAAELKVSENAAAD